MGLRDELTLPTGIRDLVLGELFTLQPKTRIHKRSCRSPTTFWWWSSQHEFLPFADCGPHSFLFVSARMLLICNATCLPTRLTAQGLLRPAQRIFLTLSVIGLRRDPYNPLNEYQITNHILVVVFQTQIPPLSWLRALELPIPFRFRAPHSPFILSTDTYDGPRPFTTGVTLLPHTVCCGLEKVWWTIAEGEKRCRPHVSRNFQRCGLGFRRMVWIFKKFF